MAKYDHVRIDGITFKPGEQWFLIRAQDRFAPAAVDAYAKLASGAIPDVVVAEIRGIAEQMRQWQAQHPADVKTPG
jgi:hypothetical protein